MKKNKIFIGSSVEGLKIAYAVQQNLRHTAETTVWDQGVFDLSSTTIESLIKVLDNSDFGIFVFSPDDIIKFRGNEALTVRDNVVFELGLFIDKNTYQFVGYDGLRWNALPDNEMLSPHELPENIIIALMFDDLPLEQPPLVSVDLFTPDDEHLDEMKEGLSDDQKPIIPQVYILSGGDITPFRLEFSFHPQWFDAPDTSFSVVGLYSTPVDIVGPFVNGATFSVEDHYGNNE